MSGKPDPEQEEKNRPAGGRVDRLFSAASAGDRLGFPRKRNGSVFPLFLVGVFRAAVPADGLDCRKREVEAAGSRRKLRDNSCSDCFQLLRIDGFTRFCNKVLSCLNFYMRDYF